ncbi:hypothetical protein ACWCW7_29445 [Nocardia tengchongensis]
MSTTRKTARRAAIATALLGAAIPLTGGTANAVEDLAIIPMSATPDQHGCELTNVSCRVLVSNLSVFTTPVTVTVNGAVLGTATPADGCCDRYEFMWNPQKAGTYTLTAQAGAQSKSATVTIYDYNSLQGILKRYVGS